MSWEKVRAWRQRLRDVVPPTDVGLSVAGANEAWQSALQALDDQSLDEIASMRVDPWTRAAVVCASTVFTAPIEWCAVLLGRGSEVTLKVPSAQPDFGRALVDAAQETGLPLTSTTDRRALERAEYVIAMGSDEAIRQIARELPRGVQFEPHGNRFSAAWIGGEGLDDDPLVPGDFQDPLGSVAADAALYDGRGCLSPVVLFTSVPGLAAPLAAAMERAERRWPRGQISDLEAAAIRSRRALAKVTGRVLVGDHWSVHALPGDYWQPIALPRSIALVEVSSRAEAIERLAPHQGALSTMGTDQPWPEAPRACRLGRMQRPPLRRLHDGVDWLRTTARPQ